MQRWHGPGGIAHVLRIGLPLLAGMGSITAMHLTDRIFLGWYSQDALAASLPAGATFFLLTSFFLGTAGYAGVLVAQHVGAGQTDKVGRVVWQGVWFAVASFAPLILLALAAGPIFAAMGHPAEVRSLEETYYRVLMLGAGFMVLEAALAAFFSGRGLTRVVMCVNIGGAILNIPLNYLLIFGNWGLPSLGVAGSALATVTAWAAMAGAYGLLIFTRRNDGLYGVFRGRALDRPLFARLVRLGMPGGAQVFLDVFAATVFIALAGRIGKAELTATSIVLSANTPAFLPLIGLSQGLAVIVGQSMGAGRPAEAVRAAGSAVWIMAVYMAVMAAVFLSFPDQLALIFRPNQADASFGAALAYCRPLFAWVAVIGFCDVVIHAAFGVLRGAGDTRYLMMAAALVSAFALVAPAWLAVTAFSVGVVGLWGVFAFYAAVMAVVLWLRCRGGAWQTLRLVRPTGEGQ
ncbi:MAG TPA: MATE family efflux transporter [Solidesulfovibrio magneticus]|nr:MATE family efflux transporter [Solidesulfovibrio magneticus]